jgi:hypothetical protein
MKLDILLCLKCFGRIDLVNFSPWVRCQLLTHDENDISRPYLYHDEGIAGFPPSRYILM